MKTTFFALVTSLFIFSVFLSDASAQNNQNVLKATSQHISYDNMYVKDGDKLVYIGTQTVLNFEGIFTSSNDKTTLSTDSIYKFSVFDMTELVQYTIVYDATSVQKEDGLEIIKGKILKRYMNATQIPWEYSGTFVIDRTKGSVAMKEN